MPNYENETKLDEELIVASQKTTPIYYPQVIGQFAGGSAQDYGNPRLNEIHISPGQNIQDALTALGESGGGVLRLKNGTYFASQNIDVPSNVTLEGSGLQTTIISFADTAFSVRLVGIRRTSAGSVDFTEGSVTVSGTTTSFTQATPGDFFQIVAEDATYIAEILSIESDTSLTLVDVYPLASISGISLGGSTTLVSLVRNSSVKDLTIRDSAVDGIDIQYADNIIVERVRVYSCSGDGFDIDSATNLLFSNVESSFHTERGWEITVIQNALFLNCLAVGNTGDGFNYGATAGSSGEQVVFFACISDGNTGDGFEVTAKGTKFLACKAVENDGAGFHIVGANDCIIDSFYSVNNGTDGIELDTTARRTIIRNGVLERNDAFGIDIGLATDTRIDQCQFVSNSSGNIRDGGTTTFYDNGGAGAFTAANGANNDIDIGEQKYTRISGPTLAYNITGVANTANAKMVTLFNTTAQDMTLTNQATSDDTQQILTLTGADVTLTGTSLARLQYDATSKKWVLLGTQG